MKSVIAIVFVLVCSIMGYSQTMNEAIQDVNIQEKVLLKTIEFDSLILIDKISFWNEGLEMIGIGFIDHKYYSMKISFIRDDSISYKIHIDRFAKKRIRSREKIDLLGEVCLRKLSALHNDSLNIKTRGEIYEEISDASYWIVIIVDEEVVIQQSYAPNIYQESVPTMEREYFINSVNTIEGIFK